MKYFLLIFAIVASVSLYFYIDKEPVVTTAGSLSAVESENVEVSSEDIRDKKRVTHSKVKSLSSNSLSSEKKDEGSYFSVDKDCYTDYARKIYEDMLYEYETRNWLTKRKYDLYYQNSHLKNYQNFSKSTLRSMASNGDTRAMMRIGFDALIEGKDSEAEEWYKKMLIAGDFSSIDQFIVLYKMNIAEADNSSEKAKFKEKLLNWIAFKRKVNGLELFNLTAEYEPYLSKENSVWAENRLFDINKVRVDKGLQAIGTQPLPETVKNTLNKLKKFYLEQQSISNSPCKYNM